jgi:hypothetical protein
MLYRPAIVACFVAVVALGCDTDADDAVPLQEDVETADAPVGVADGDVQRFTANLTPVNQHLLDSSPSGEATIEIRGDSIVIRVTAQGLPPNMTHLQHFHGFEDGSPARCPGADADANGDGVVDVTETAPMAGTTMVPFHAHPANMEIQAETYPRADGQGAYSYRHAVPLEAVRSAFQEKFGGELALENRVVFIHGVPDDVTLPESVATKAGLPPRVSLPIACGELEPAL